MKNKLLLISGPTASGKTKLALKLAREFNGEIISADSRQVYQGMNIVTGKDLENAKFNVQTHCNASLQNKQNYNLGYYLLQNIPVYGLDLVKPDQPFDVSDFVKIARIFVSHIQNQNKIPIIVGGTAFWLKNLLSPAATIGVPVDKKLRQELEKLTLQDLQQKLKKLNQTKFSFLNNSDINNPRRLIRAIEIYSNNTCRDAINRVSTIKTYFWLSLNPDPKILATKISNRVEERIKSGAIKEAQTLSSKYSWDLPSMSAIGYKDLKFCLEKKQNLEEAKKNWILHETQYAKRQLTFLKKMKNIKWFDLQETGSYDKIKQEINKFLHN